MHLITKRSVIISVIMTILLCVVCYFIFGAASAQQHPAEHTKQHSPHEFVDVTDAEANKVLKLVHVAFRHGQRTPADTYVNDPHINETFAPYGWAQLTNKGKSDLFDMGVWLRKRYNKFLGEEFNLDHVHAQSTGISRTKMSLALALAGLFPPRGTSNQWSKNLNWQPIPYDYQPLDKDDLLLVRVPCPRYYEELERVIKEEPEFAKLQEENKQLYEELTNVTGTAIVTPEDVQSLYATLRAESEFGLELPDFIKYYYPERMQVLTEKSFVLNIYNDELKKLKAGPFLTKILNDWKQVRSNTLKPQNRKIFLYAGHDSTVVNILAGFKVWELQFPGYAIMALFELYEDKVTKDLSVKIYIKPSPESPEKLLTVPGCEELCPLAKLEQLTQSIVFDKASDACKAHDPNFVQPALGGP